MEFLATAFFVLLICLIPCVVHAAVRRYDGEAVGGLIAMLIALAGTVLFYVLDRALG
jgi:uncharacterized membrane protein